MSAGFARIQVIVNPAAGGTEPILNTLNEVFSGHALRWAVSVTQQAGDGTRQARAAVEAGADVIAAYGGDGTLMEVANGLVHSGVPLAILPGGTGNALAYELGIPQQLYAAAALLCSAPRELRAIDLGRIGERYFLLRANMGLFAAFTTETSRMMKNRFGIFAYLLGALRGLRRTRRARYRLAIDGRVFTADGDSCLVANSGRLGGLNLSLASAIRLDDGLLDVFVIKGDLEATLSMAASMIAPEQFTAAVQHWQGRKIKIVARPAQNIRIDGELYGKTPVTAHVMPGALRVVVPAAQAAAQAAAGEP